MTMEKQNGFMATYSSEDIRVRVGMEASGYARWFERLLAQLEFELWIGNPAEIPAQRVKKRKTDRADARLLLRLLREDRFPKIWVASPENRDLRQLLWHRHRLVQLRTRIMNQLQALAMNQGKRWKSKLWSQPGPAEFEKLTLAAWGNRRRSELLALLEPFESEHPGADHRGRPPSAPATRGIAVDDPSRRHAYSLLSLLFSLATLS